MKETVISGIPLFASLDSKAKRFLLRVLRHADLAAGEILFREGEAADRFYVVLDGQLEAVKAMGTRAERLLSVMGAGEYIGEVAFLLPDGCRSASVRACTFVQLLAMDRDAFGEAVDRFPSLALEISRRLASKLRNAENTRTQDLLEASQRTDRRFQKFRSELLQMLHEGNPLLARSKLLEMLSRMDTPAVRPGAAHKRTGVVKGVLHDDRDARLLSLSTVCIETLGVFRVLRGEVPMEDGEWGGNRPKLLLKALVARYSRKVPKENLFDDLWPESDAAACDACFKVTLHRLRKALEPSLDRSFGSSYVHLSGNLLSLDPRLCSVDADEFTSLCRRGSVLHHAGDLKEALAVCSQALELYRGDFLPDDQYVPWVETRRHELRESCLLLLCRMGEVSEALGNAGRAVQYYGRAFLMDPISEEVCRRLMTLYSGKGMRNAAVRTYETCRKALREELDSEPEDLTRAVYKRIQQH